MNGQAFLGCKINLISRAGIRYEGILYTIDANNSTVALSKVKSFGTEDRYAETAVPPRDEIYEYIIFRGSDIQDLHVCEAPKKQPQLMAQDPAILEITGKPPIQTTYSRRRVQFTSRPYQGDDQEIPYIEGMRPGQCYQGYNDENTHDPWPDRVPSRSYYSRSRSHYPNENYSLRNPPIFYPEFPRYNTYRRRSGFSGSDRNMKVPSSSDQPMRKNATLRRNPRRSSSLNMRSMGSKSMVENGHEMSRTSSGNSRSTNMSGRPESQNGPEYKYDKEYDFESANAEIAKELDRLTVEKNSVSTITGADVQNVNHDSKTKGPTGDSERPENNDLNPESQMNGVSEPQDLMTTPATNNGTSDLSVNKGSNNLVNNNHEENDEGAKDSGDNITNYDRAKSFYDNISSESTDRAKGKMIRAINWRDERKLNVETFGFTMSGANVNRQALRRNISDSGNSINASNSMNRNMPLPNSFYKQDMMRYHHPQPPPPTMSLPPSNSYYHQPLYYQQPQPSYYQPRWFSSSRRPDYYREPTYVQGWN